MPLIEIQPIDFLGQGALLEPVDKVLHDKAVEYAARELQDPVNFIKLAKVWVGLKDGQVKGVCGYVLRPDIPLFRATDFEVLRAMGQRMNAFFSDNGWRGYPAFLYMGNEPEEQRCPQWRQALKEFRAQSAHRFMIEVK